MTLLKSIMPNYCMNTLTMTGTTDDLKKFLSENQENEKSTCVSLEKALPVPENTTNPVVWRHNHWGTRGIPGGDSYATMEWEKETVVNMQFESAWSPPDKWVKHVGTKYPSIVFELWYDEPNCRFKGYLKVENGKIVEEEYESDYESSGDEDDADSVS